MGTYLPSRSGSNYTAPDEYFYKSQAVFKDFCRVDGEGARADVLRTNYVTMRTALNNATC